MHIIPMSPDQLHPASLFIASLQTEPNHHVAYFGQTEAEIAAAISEFDPEDGSRALLAVEDTTIIGFLGVDASSEIKRAWLHGPFADAEAWNTVADALYMQAKTEGCIPDWVTEEELFADAANTHIAAFADRHGFTPGTPQASLRLGRDDYRKNTEPNDTSSVQIVELSEPRHLAFIALHDLTFPKTYYSGREIIERLGERDKALIALKDDILVGYLYARMEPGATNGYIDFLGVTTTARRQGIGARLIQEATNWLFTFPEIGEITLTVDAENQGAISLYTSLGFHHIRTMQVYRKRTVG